MKFVHKLSRYKPNLVVVVCEISENFRIEKKLLLLRYKLIKIIIIKSNNLQKKKERNVLLEFLVKN